MRCESRTDLEVVGRFLGLVERLREDDERVSNVEVGDVVGERLIETCARPVRPSQSLPRWREKKQSQTYRDRAGAS